jgi:hypothetical protein
VRNHTRAWSTIAGSLTAAVSLATLVTPAAEAKGARDLSPVSAARATQNGNISPACGPFNNSVAGYEDNVVSWPSVEPSLDYSAISLLAFWLGASRLG